ncbi:hypothetical protein ACSBR2_001283 [Camellia fascicularis]
MVPGIIAIAATDMKGTLIFLMPCNMTCINLLRTYNCSYPDGYQGNDMKNGSDCNPIPVPNHRLPLIIIALGRQRKIINLREKFFQQNGGIMLQQKLSKREGSVQPAKSFIAEDLKKAPNNYHESRVLDQGGQGTVYKVILSDNTIVAIKKSKVADQSQSQIEQFINEVIFLSQVNHKCCEASRSTNILLDDNYIAKVSDFGASRLIPIDQSQLTTLIQGTLGYLDPEYFHTSQLTEKSNVYSFGVVLVELLTGKKALSFDRPKVEKNLAKYFVSSMKEDCLFEIVNEQVMNEAKAD